MFECLDRLHLLAQDVVELFSIFYHTTITPSVVAMTFLGHHIAQASPFVQHIGLSLIFSQPLPLVATHIAVRLLARLEGEVATKLFRCATVVMHGPYIGFNVRVAAGIVHRSGAINHLRHIIQVLHKAGIYARIGGAPGFVQRRPGNQRRVVAVALYQFGPLRDKVAASHFIIYIETPAGTLAPSEVAQLISPIVVTLFKTLLVQAGTIEAHSLRHLYIFLQGSVGGRCPDAVGVIALVKHQALIVGLIIKVEVAVGQMHLAHTSIRQHLVNYLAILHHLILHAIEEGVLGAPQFHTLYGQHHHRVVATHHTLFDHHLVAIINTYNELIGGVLAIKLRAYHKLLLVDVGGSKHALQAFFINGLHPYRLPDARNTGVHTSVRTQLWALFAARLHTAAQVVVYLYHEVVRLSGFYIAGNVATERRPRTVMQTHQLAINIDVSLIVDRAKVQQHLLALPCSRNVERALIPYTVNKVGVMNARQRALGAEGNRNFSIEALGVVPAFLLTRLAKIETVRPCAVEVHPLFTFKLWARILRTRSLRVGLTCA